MVKKNMKRDVKMEAAIARKAAAVKGMTSPLDVGESFADRIVEKAKSLWK